MPSVCNPTWVNETVDGSFKMLISPKTKSILWTEKIQSNCHSLFLFQLEGVENHIIWPNQNDEGIAAWPVVKYLEICIFHVLKYVYVI